MDAYKLRAISSNFKRHTIRRMIRPAALDPTAALYGHSATQSKLRQSVSDYMFVFTRQVLPKMEEKIELLLLEKFKDRIGNPMERKEVIQAYLQRKDNVARMEEPLDITQPEKRKEQIKISHEEMQRVIMTIEGEGLSYHTFEDIGRYTVFPEKHYKRMFPTKFFGNYEKDEFERNRTFGIMTREEGLRFTNDLARLTLPSQRKFDYESLLSFENKEVKEEILKDEQNFLAVQQDFSNDLLEYIESTYDPENSENWLNVHKLFQNPSTFDAFVTILAQELRKKPIRYHLCIKEARMKVIDQFVKQMLNVMHEKKLNPQSMFEIIENQNLFVFDLDRKLLGKYQDIQKNEVHQYKLYASGYQKVCNGLWRPEDVRRVSLNRFKGANSGLFLWGPRGCGKSQILSYISAWAHENKWFVLNIPRAEMFTDGSEETFRYKNGLYLQNPLGRQLLFDLRTSNEKLLRETDVNLSVYGRMDISGVKDGEKEPCPRFWDEERQCWSDSWKENLYDFEIKSIQQKYDDMNYRLKDKLPEPKKLIDIVDFGIDNEILATNAFAELLEQLYHNDKFHTLIAIDGYNDWFKPSSYLSFRYENSNKLHGTIPPQDLAFVRMLMKFDGHKIKNGVKVCATTHYRQFNHLCTPDMLYMPDGYTAKVENLTLNEFRNMIYYYNITEWCGDFWKEFELESYYMETQGNWWAYHESFNRRKRGALHQEDEDLIFIKNVFKEIPVFKDIPNNFKLDVTYQNNVFSWPILLKRSHSIPMIQQQIKVKSQTSTYSSKLQNTKFPSNSAQQEVQNFDDAILQTNNIKLRKQTIVNPKDISVLLQQQKVPESQNSPTNKDSKNSNSANPEEAEPQWKKSDDVKIIQICDCFGQYYSLTGNKWRPSFVMAIKDGTLVLKASVQKIDQMLNFLGLTIFGFDKISAAARDKIARCFTEKQFFPGQKLIKEGTIQNTAYIIKEGDVTLMSRQNPTNIKVTEDGRILNKERIASQGMAHDKRKRGYMSKTTNCFQFGVKGKNQWVGEDILILGQNETFYFSAIAMGRVTVIEISRNDMMSKLPYQCVKFLEKSSQKRKEFVQLRMININQTVKQVIKQAEEQIFFEDENEKKVFQHQRSQAIQQKIRSLTETVLEKAKTKKKTINMKIKSNLVIEDQGKDESKTQDNSTISLPIIENPRDKALLTAFSKKNVEHNSLEDEIHINLKSINFSNAKERIQNRKEINNQSQSPQDLQKKFIIKINNKIDNQNIKKYTEEAIRNKQNGSSDLRQSRLVGLSQSQQKTYYLKSGQQSRHNQSLANISLMDQSEFNDRNYSMMSPSKSLLIDNQEETNKNERKVALQNATTLRPYLVLKQRRELVPIFYQRNPKKTRNAIANSVHAIKIQHEMSVDSQSNIDQSRISSPLKSAKDESVRYSKYNTESKTLMARDESLDYYQINQTYAVQPSVYEFNISNNNLNQTPQFSNSSLKKIDAKLKKEAQIKYASFMLGNTKINELDKNIMNQKGIFINGVNREQSNYSDIKAQTNDNEYHSREGTPNPWEIYKKREQLKNIMISGVSRMSNYQSEANVKIALSYLNCDI